MSGNKKIAISKKRAKIVVLGGDGFCGWPTTLHLSRAGHSVTIIDNLSRREIDVSLGTKSLTAISSLEERVGAWKELTGQDIGFHQLDLSRDFTKLCDVLNDIRPDAIVHFGEQRSAPYSMMSAEARCYTITNNISATHNVLAAMVHLGLDAHLVHLGSIGVYGYTSAGMQLPEGYVRATLHNDHGQDTDKEILYPGQQDSVYHMSKAQDQLLFAFYARQENLRITDLHQGIVWGTQTPETEMDARLINRFDYDTIYGTVVNRFLVQASVGHPLTVYGTGEQTRAYIHLRDTVRCIETAITTPPARGDRVRIINQIAETKSVADLAGQVAALSGGDVVFLDNPRKEPVRNDFEVDHKILGELGVETARFETMLAREYDLIQSSDKARLIEKHLAPENRGSERSVVA